MEVSDIEMNILIYGTEEQKLEMFDASKKKAVIEGNTRLAYLAALLSINKDIKVSE